MIVFACAVLSGVLFYLSQGLDNVWALTWIAPLPLLWLAYGDTRAWALLCASFAAYMAGQIYVLQCYGTLLLASTLPVMLGSGLLFAGAVLFARATWQVWPALALLAFPSAWTAVEYLLGWVSPNGSWGALGYSQVSWPAAIQIASLFGLYAVTFVLCLFANALALAARGRRAVGMLGVTLCAASILFGYARLAAAPGPVVRVVALADEGRDYVQAFKTGNTAAALAVTRGYAAAVVTESARGARLFVTPENGVSVDPRNRDRILAPLVAAARATGSVIVAGTGSRTPARDMALAFLPDGRIKTYDKRHLLLPLEARYTPGRASGVIGGGLAMAVCKDMDFPRSVRADTSGSIRLMAVPAGDFLLDDWIHARMAIMRGVENGFAVTRSAFNGLETVSDAQGRVLARARVDRPGLIAAQADVPLGPGSTLYKRIGDAFAWFCLACALGIATALLRRRRAPASDRG